MKHLHLDVNVDSKSLSSTLGLSIVHDAKRPHLPHIWGIDQNLRKTLLLVHVNASSAGPTGELPEKLGIQIATERWISRLYLAVMLTTFPKIRRRRAL